MEPVQVNFSSDDLHRMIQRRLDAMKAPVPTASDPLAKMKIAISKVPKVL